MSLFSFISGVMEFLIAYSPYFLIVLAVTSLFSIICLILSFFRGVL